jgi:DNA-binding transcriptional regulator GbsR (MarR family)
MLMGLREIKKFVETVERMMTRWGYTHTDAKVYAYLLLSEEPLSINDLAELTNLSRSSISVALSKLTKDYMVNVRKVGKTKFFTPIPAFFEKFLHQPKETLEKEAIPLKETVEKLIETTTDPEYRMKLQSVLDDLLQLECALRQIIELEKNYRCGENLKKE